jgi:formate-dependent phosphoribosylglycinamide formyltransferase (GAR transformylase)
VRRTHVVTTELGGLGISVEFFIRDDRVWFSGSPRPHDTGWVTMPDLHLRCTLALGPPVPHRATRQIPRRRRSGRGDPIGSCSRSTRSRRAIAAFGKPWQAALAVGRDIADARAKARAAAAGIKPRLE